MPGALPSACIREVANDCITQAESESCLAEIFYQLAGAYFNGAVIKRDPVLGLSCLRRAVEAGQEEAIGSLYNVFEGCGSFPPHGIQLRLCLDGTQGNTASVCH